MKDSVLLVQGKKHDKLDAHINGLQHYACSVIVFNSELKILLQKRSDLKYHSGGLWTNTCCTHLLSTEREKMKTTAEDRLFYEIGLKCRLQFSFSFSYNVVCENNLIENEIDFVFVGYSDESPNMNENEVCDYKWMNVHDILIMMQTNPESFTKWFHIIMTQHLNKFYSTIRLKKSHK